MAANMKDTLHTLADRLPDNATWDDVMEEVRFRRAVEVGIQAAERGGLPRKKKSGPLLRAGGVNIAG